MHVLHISYGTCMVVRVQLLYNVSCSGNYVGRHPFTKGDACTECGSGKGWCDNGLCREGERFMLNIEIIIYLGCLPSAQFIG